MKPSSAIMFVSVLERSIDFYTNLLQLTVTVRDTSAALLVGADHFELYLKSQGTRSVLTLGSIGIQYLVWTADSELDLRRCEAVLRDVSAHVTTQEIDGFQLVEGPGPDGVPIVIVYPGPDELSRGRIIPRIYNW